ncbi:MMPL family transporter [Ruania halotolerans]|uniref:MMPL family transporter n=1 Tax=Ruania halotolerans TaxID=2897773 RepID=UPI001E617755|nr:MMPL family transporter [Ruania halotolerans]UFU05621.1 MMPL family transporter [Ruania halotolerans]
MLSMLTNSAGGRRPALVRSLVVGFALVAWLAIGGFGGMAQGNLSSVQENDQAAFLPESAESTRASELIAEFSVDESLPALLVVEAADGENLTQEDFATIGAFAESIPGLDLPGGASIADYLTAGQVPVVPSEDGAAALLPVSLDAAQASDLVGEDDERVSTAVVERLRAEVGATLADAGLAGWVTGPAAGVADLVSAFAGIDGILLGVALAVVLVILAIVYRSPLLPFAVILTSVFSLCLAALVIVPLAGGDVLLLNGQSQGILSILVIGAATDYSLLLVARYREELTRHQHPAAAMKVAWRATLEPIAASAGTVIVGLLCLLLSDLGSNASLGPVAAIGIAAAVCGALTLLPALLLVLGSRSRAVFWPSRPRYVPDDAAPAAASDSAGKHVKAESHGIWSTVANVVTTRARTVWVSTAVVLLILAGFATTFQAEGTSDTDVFLNETESVAGEEVLAAHFEVGTVQPIEVVVPQGEADAVIAAAEDVDGVTAASVVRDGESGPGEGEVLVVDGRVLVEVTTEDSAESQAVLSTVADLRSALGEVAGETLVGGEAAQRLDTQETAERDLRTIIPVVLVVIALMLALLLRAVVAPLVLLAANVLSFAATMGLAALVFNHILDFPGADATVPLYGFVFLVALGIDYSIFLMTRVREESVQLGTRPGVRKGLAVTGGVITSAGLVLAATFSALWVIPLLFLAQLAFIVAVGVLIDTFVVRSLLVPGLVHDLGRRTWWPWAKRVPQD